MLAPADDEIRNLKRLRNNTAQIEHRISYIPDQVMQVALLQRDPWRNVCAEAQKIKDTATQLIQGIDGVTQEARRRFSSNRAGSGIVPNTKYQLCHPDCRSAILREIEKTEQTIYNLLRAEREVRQELDTAHPCQEIPIENPQGITTPIFRFMGAEATENFLTGLGIWVSSISTLRAANNSIGQIIDHRECEGVADADLYFVSSWCHGDEAVHMWETYADAGQGLRIELNTIPTVFRPEPWFAGNHGNLLPKIERAYLSKVEYTDAPKTAPNQKNLVWRGEEEVRLIVKMTQAFSGKGMSLRLPIRSFVTKARSFANEELNKKLREQGFDSAA